MTSFILKCIAMATMFVDHFGDAYFKNTTLMNLVGRIAFPIFAFQISEGYIHTKNLKKYFLRLFLFAVISQIPFYLFNSIFKPDFTINVFGTLFLGLLSIYVYDKIVNSKFAFTKNAKMNSIFSNSFRNFYCNVYWSYSKLIKM